MGVSINYYEHLLLLPTTFSIIPQPAKETERGATVCQNGTHFILAYSMVQSPS